MRNVIQTVRAIIAILFTAVALTTVFTACSGEYASPLSSGTEGTVPSPTKDTYAPLSDEILAAGPVPGYRFLELPGSTLDANNDSMSISRFCRADRDTRINFANILELEIPANALTEDVMVTIVAPYGRYAIADFYPHPLQFTSTVKISWKVSHLNFPAGTDFSTFAPFYVDDNGDYVQVPYEWHNGYDELWVYTDHFSRYIIGQIASN